MLSELDDYNKLQLDTNESITRGIVAYLPRGMAEFEKQLKSLYLSVAIMRTHQPVNFRTDLIIFAPPDGQKCLKDLGCTTVLRKFFDDSEQCVIKDYIPITERGTEINSFDPPFEYSGMYHSF